MKKKGLFKFVGFTLLAVLLAASLLLVWLYSGKLTLAKQKVFLNLPLPIAAVSRRPIYLADFQVRYQAAIKAAGQIQETETLSLKKTIFNGIIQERKIREVANKSGVTVNNGELDREYERLSRSTDLQGKKNFQDYLAGFGLTEREFKDSVLKPQVLAAKLEIWFNEQKSLNAQPYQIMESLQAKLAAGQSLENLAATFSQDPSSAALEGDLGYLTVADLLPELQEQVDAMNEGQTKLVTSRYGLHLVKIEEKDNEGPQNTARVRLKQVFIKANDFQKWLETQTEQHRVRVWADPVF